MRSSNNIIAVAVLAGLAAASPAPQQLDFNQIAAAATVAAGPSADGVPIQTASILTTASASTTATASVTGAATSVASASASAAVQKRTVVPQSASQLVAEFWCAWFGVGCSATSSSSSSSSSSVKSSTVSSTTSTSSSIAAAAATSVYTPYYPALATVTEYTTGTTTISSTSACPTTPEEGTYCGFINPEDPCAPQPDGYGPVPTPDTVSAFYAYAPFHSMASAAPTTIPAAASATASGIATVYNQTFKDLNASSSAQSYIGLYTLQTYNATQCAALCDGTSLCTAFNIYIERDPSVK